MKKASGNKKLTIKREAVRTLTPEQAKGAAGGTYVPNSSPPSHCHCTTGPVMQ
jgi:hypothetical protein